MAGLYAGGAGEGDGVVIGAEEINQREGQIAAARAEAGGAALAGRFHCEIGEAIW